MSEVGMKKSELDTPVLWVDLELLEGNIATLAEHFRSAGVDWRPHTKGMKVPAIAHKAIAAGAIGVTCAKLSEAEVMAAAGIRDILIANQIVGSTKIARLVNLQRHAEVKVAVDDVANIRQIGQMASERGVEVGVLVDINSGLNRTGVAPGQAGVELSKLAADTAGINYLGLMAYEGHTIDITDNPKLKRQEIEKAVGLLNETVTMCREAGLPVEIVSGGGSGTYKVTPFLPGVTEMQAGGAIFCDVAYRTWDVETEPALFVRVSVTSRPAPDRITYDAGWKALPAWVENPKPLGLAGVKEISTSAEHGTIILDGPNETVKVSDAIDFMVGYGDNTVFLHDRLYGVRDDIVEVIWDIQGRGKLR